jgi:hypothetical protein
VKLSCRPMGSSAGTGVRPLRHQLGARFGWRHMKLPPSACALRLTKMSCNPPGCPLAGGQRDAKLTYRLAVVRYHPAQSQRRMTMSLAHGLAQILAAVRRRIPLLLLITRLMDGVESLRARQALVAIEVAGDNDVSFRRPLLPFRGSAAGQFETAARFFTGIMARLSLAIATTLEALQHISDDGRPISKSTDWMDQRYCLVNEANPITVRQPAPGRRRALEAAGKALREDVHAFPKSPTCLAQTGLPEAVQGTGAP